MAHRRIGIGETNSFRYIGVEPPLDDTEAGRIVKVVAVPRWVEGGIDYHTEEVEGNPPYTEFSADVGRALDLFDREFVDKGTVGLAYAIGRLLEEKGDTVEVLDRVIPTDFEHPIFGEEADALRALCAQIRERHQAHGS